MEAKQIISIGCDHAGFNLKENIVARLDAAGYGIIDHGTYSTASVDYPDFIHPVAEDIEHQQVNIAIIICGSGNGAAITANKHPHVRAALCWNTELAALARKHNDANVLSIPARFVSEEMAMEMVHIFLNTEFEGGRHAVRVQKIPCA